MRKTIIFSLLAVAFLAGCNDTKTDNKKVSKQESTPVVKQEVKKVEPVAKVVVKEEQKVEQPQQKEQRRANPAKGQKLFARKLKESCGMKGGEVAKKHTQDEWSAIEKSGKLKDEIKSICPKASDSALKDKYIENYYDFFYNYATDSGNIPSC